MNDLPLSILLLFRRLILFLFFWCLLHVRPLAKERCVSLFLSATCWEGVLLRQVAAGGKLQIGLLLKRTLYHTLKCRDPPHQINFQLLFF